jgi:Rod binding domain-containing protein
MPAATSGSTGVASSIAEGRAKQLKNQEFRDEKEIDKAASGFEALLLQQMMQSMWSTVEFSGMFNEDGNQASIYRDMFNQAIADETAKGRGMGVKEYVKQQLTRVSAKEKGNKPESLQNE